MLMIRVSRMSRMSRRGLGYCNYEHYKCPKCLVHPTNTPQIPNHVDDAADAHHPMSSGSQYTCPLGCYLLTCNYRNPTDESYRWILQMIHKWSPGLWINGNIDWHYHTSDHLPPGCSWQIQKICSIWRLSFAQSCSYSLLGTQFHSLPFKHSQFCLL